MTKLTQASADHDLQDEQLHSTFALDLLTQVARHLPTREFATKMSYIFGEDIPEYTYGLLQEQLLAGKIANPEIVMTKNGYDADYDNRERVIRIYQVIVMRALGGMPTDHLLDILLHEFGHHIDNLLRHDLSDGKARDGGPLAADADREEGVRFSFWMAYLGQFDDKPVHIATYRYLMWDESFDLHVDWTSAHKLIMKDHNDDYGRTDSSGHQNPDREAFEAGSEDAHGHTHQTIEWGLREAGFTREQIDAVYFGNWLRDYSQVVDPKITRAPDMPKEFPTVLSREAWSSLVDVLAARKFYDLRLRYPAEMKVTSERLGVYRPQEHIDNPVVSDPPFPDPKVRDPDFEPWVLPGDPLNDADPATSMKRYISQAVAYMQQQLRRAMDSKGSLDGLRSFGAALHVLEDLFAHSNFVELSLIRSGHAKVLPWTTPVQVKWNLALVTGTFGATDIVASLAAPLGRILFSTQELEFELTQPGYRSDRDRVMLILLSEHPDQDYYNAFNALLEARDGLVTLAKKMGVDTLKFYRWLINTPAAILLNAYNSAAQGVLTWIGNSVDDAQTLLGSDPNEDPGVEPTHSQLSKDHAEHPLHDLAALLATEAVAKVGQALTDYWAGKPDADPLAVATAFFCHPADAQWQYPTVDAWAQSHPDEVARSASKSELDKIHQATLDQLRTVQAALVKDSRSYLDYVFNSEDQQPSNFQGYLEQAFIKLVANTTWWKELQRSIQA